MKNRIFITCFIFLSSFPTIFNSPAQNSGNKFLELEKTIPLPNVTGRIDHLAIDQKRQIVFIAALGNNTVEVVDLKKEKVIHSIKNMDEPQGIIYIPGNDVVFVANGGNGKCDVFNAESFQLITSVKLEGDADNVRYDAAAKKIYIGYGNGGIVTLDATNYKQTADVKLAGHPESFQLAQAANKIYVNVPDAQQVEIIDTKKNAVIEQRKITEAEKNYPMALDAVNHRLFIGCRQPAKLLVMDDESGKTISVLDCSEDVDDIFYDEKNKLIYLSCGGGFIDVFRQDDANKYELIEKIPSRSGARTCLFVPEKKQLLLAAPAREGKDAALLIYETK